jgi:D-alanine-D-alanine ligase
MSQASVLVLCNQPVLPKDHPDAESEHSVIDVAELVQAALRAEGFHVAFLALGSDPVALWRQLKKHKPDVVFNLYEGQADWPETESYVAGLLEWAKIPYTGSPFATLTVARNKDTAKCLLRGAGLPTAEFMLIERAPIRDCPLEFPVLVKPARQDASVGVDQDSVCVNRSQLDKRVRYILANYGAPVLVEEYIDGREVNVPLIELPELQALAAAEMVFDDASTSKWPIMTYAAKWDTNIPSRIPADLPARLRATLNDLAMKTYRLFGCRDYARVDFRMNAKGKPHILEINPNPDISELADLTRSLVVNHLTHRDFIVRLVRQALGRK